MPKTGRPKGPRITVPCAAGAKCAFAIAGEPGLIEKYPSQVAAAKTGRLFHNAACRNAGGAKPARPKVAVCQNPDHPASRPRQFTFSSRSYQSRTYCSFECYGMVRQKSVITAPCAWCGLPVITKVSSRSKKHYHGEEAPEPSCGWPEGVRMTCAQLGRYKNLERPLRFVNGKPVRMWIDRRFKDRSVQRPMVWDPEKGESGDWEFEHRYLWQQANGVKLTQDVHIHHKDEDKLNNDLDNLQKLTPSEHLALHNAERIAAAAENDRLRELLRQHGINPDA